MNILNSTTNNSDVEFLDNLEIFFSYATGLPFDYLLENHNFVLRKGQRRVIKGKQEDIYTNVYYHAPSGREDIQEFYKQKDLAKREETHNKLVEYAKKSGNPQSLFPLQEDNGIYGQDHFMRFLRIERHKGTTLYFAPNSVDSGVTEGEVDKWGDGLTQVIRVEHDNKAPIADKRHYLERCGLPSASLWLDTTNKSLHNLFCLHTKHSYERVAEMYCQIVRQSGHDGYSDTIKTTISKLKTLLLRIPGFNHQKSGKQTYIYEIGNIYEIEDLEAQVYQLPRLGDYKLQKDSKFIPDTFPGGEHDFETIISPDWKNRFHPYESYVAYKAKLEAKAEADKARLEAARVAREQQKQGLSAQEIQRRADSINGEEVSLLQFVDFAVKLHIENGTPDGTGRSHKVATYIAKSLLEAEYLINGSLLKAIESAEALYQKWVDRTFHSGENDLIKKVWKTYRLFEGKTNIPNARQVDKFESFVATKQDVKVGEDAIRHLVHSRTIFNLIEEAVRDLKQKPQNITFADLPILYNTAENGWNNSVAFLNDKKAIYVTTSVTHALNILETGIPGVVYVNQETSALNLHLLAQYACENGFTLNFTPNAPSTDRMLAEKLRAGFFSQDVRQEIKKAKKDTKIKDYKPTVIVVDENYIEWSAHYYWVRVPQIISPQLLGNRSKKDSVLYGYTANHKWFSDVVTECESVAKNRKLIAFVSEMGTGKTHVLANQAKNWSNGKLLAIAHREQLTRQAARRLRLIDYKSSVYKNAKEKYEKAQEQGLAITINTLCQGTNEQGYLPDFKIDDWKNATLVIDEAESFVKYLIESGTIAENRQKAITALKELVQVVFEGNGKIILADANLRISTIKLFEKWCGVDKFASESISSKYNCYIIHNSYCKFKEEGRKAIFTDNRDGLNSEVYRRLADDGSHHKSLFFTDVKQASSKYYFSTQSFGNYLRDQKLGRILDADTRQFNDDPDHKLVEDLHAAIVACHKGVVFISPVIDSGTDWNNLGLDCVYGVYMGIMGIDNTLQQLERVRDNVPRYIWAARRSSMGMTRGDIQNLEKHFEDVKRSYDGSKVALMQTWADMKVLQHGEIESRIAAQFPELDKSLLEWWQSSLEENFYAAQELRINLIARMQEKGYTIEHQDFESDVAFIATLQEFGNAQKEQKYSEIAFADLALLEKIEKNDDTMPKATARAKDLRSVLYSIGVKDDDSAYGWKAGYNEEDKLELVRRVIGKKSKTRKMLVYGFSFRCAMSNGQEQIAKIIYMAEEFRNMINSSSRSIKDTPMSMRAGIDFMIDTMDIKGLASVLLTEASKRGKNDDGRPVMFFHNRMPVILKTHKILVDNRAYVKKTFGFDVDVRPEMAARNISAFFTSIGWNVEKGKNREAGEGKARNGNAPLNNYTIKEDKLTLKIWTAWVWQYEHKDEGMFSYFYNPSGDEGGDALWKTHLGLDTGEKDKQISKQVYQRLGEYKQTELMY